MNRDGSQEGPQIIITVWEPVTGTSLKIRVPEGCSLEVLRQHIGEAVSAVMPICSLYCERTGTLLPHSGEMNGNPLLDGDVLSILPPRRTASGQSGAPHTDRST